uniref:N-acetyltransferase domain-containing protein n=1 Tax=Ditylum brightwellii TaxID=49249 RepID=A0A7S4V1M9_9STRA
MSNPAHYSPASLKSLAPMSLHRISRRAPPQNNRVGHRQVPHAMGGRCIFASSEHVAAIEVAIFHPSIGEIPYTLVYLSVPMDEVLQTFLDDTGLHYREDYGLAYNGKIIGRKETPRSLGLDPHAQWPAAIFEVVEFGSAKALAQLQTMNRIGAALQIDRGGFETQNPSMHLTDVDALSRVFSFLDLDDLIAVTRTCVLWHNDSQRLSLLLQLKCGAPPDVEYPAYLKLVADFSARLDLGACRARANERQQWSMIGASKELSAGWRSVSFRSEWHRPFTFVKAAGCTTMRAVQANCSADELQKMTLPLRGSQVNFMVPPSSDAQDIVNDKKKQLLHLIEKASIIHDDGRKMHDSPPGSGVADTGATATGTRSVTSGNNCGHRVIKIVDVPLREMSIKLFRSYFSPSMHYIFPLIAYQQKLNGLDFRSTQLWGVMLGDTDGGHPIGAVAWRKRKPLIPIQNEESEASSLTMRSPLPNTMNTLEVLFIAVWENYRHTECGGALVEALEDEAHKSGCKYMYVEIGREQPLARKFWGGLGFMPVTQVGIDREQMIFFQNSCLRFADTEQFVKVLTSERN